MKYLYGECGNIWKLLNGPAAVNNNFRAGHKGVFDGENKTGKPIDEKLRAAIRFHCFGSIGYVMDRMKNGMRLSSEELAEIIFDNIPESLQKYLG